MKEKTFQLLQQEFVGEGKEMNADESPWKEFNIGDTKVNKFTWVGNSGYKPLQEKHPNTPFRVFHDKLQSVKSLKKKLVS